MKNLSILQIVFVLVGFYSCQNKLDDESSVAYSSGESEVEISILTDFTTRGVELSVPDESIIDDLDVLLFDSDGKFLCWRTTFKINGKLRTTLPVGEGYDAYFFANCRSFIEKLLPDEAAVIRYKGVADWEVFRKELVDIAPQRLLQNGTSFTSLPMWGILRGQEVKDGVINYWPLLSLIRSVASVDIYVSANIDDFMLNDATLYHVPDRGFLGNSSDNIINNQVQTSDSPTDMKTILTLESNGYDEINRSIANKLYLYDNDTEDEFGNQKHTRLVIGAQYKGTKYYYPIDFESSETDKLVEIVRNRKYVFNINSVSGPGYTDKETAAEQPSIHLNVNVVEWSMAAGQMGSSGNYYLWTESREVTLYRDLNSSVVVGVESNILSKVIDLSFKTDVNGPVHVLTNGIQNNRFKVELIDDEDGYPKSLRITALGEFDPTMAAANSDTLVLLSGRIRLEIQILRYNKGVNDWELDGDINVDLGE